MKNELIFLKCNICGNVIESVIKGAGTMSCCEKDMQKLDVNTVDASKEKHVPDATRENGKLIVKIGSEPHPMLPEHYIAFIVVAQETKTQRCMLKPSDKPEAVFTVSDEAVTVYEYCNLHGLWATEIQ